MVESLKRAKDAGLYTMLNYLVFPGVTDRDDEIEAMADLIDLVGVDMIQMRNLSLDPVLYLNSLAVTGQGIGMLEDAENNIKHGFQNCSTAISIEPERAFSRRVTSPSGRFSWMMLAAVLVKHCSYVHE